jgi:hypothetical protein
MIFVEFHAMDLSGNPAPVCGDRGVLVVDGRFRLSTWIKWAQEHIDRHPKYWFTGFKIFRGENINRNGNKCIYSSGIVEG